MAPWRALVYDKWRRFAPPDKRTPTQIRRVAKRKSEGERRCPLNRLRHFSASRLSLIFRFVAYLISNCLVAENVFSCPMVFLFLRICLFVWHCHIILPKVNGVKSLFRCFDYTNIKARIFLFFR